jgi:TRAP-type C4-dicarboxylate transport system permease large subunit
MRRIWPLLLAEIVVLAAVTFIPGLAVWLPHFLGYGV